jgi:hypothetical protein
MLGDVVYLERQYHLLALSTPVRLVPQDLGT